jgi:hypothetical protein
VTLADQARRRQAERNRAQWTWMLVPIAILVFVGLAILFTPKETPAPVSITSDSSGAIVAEAPAKAEVEATVTKTHAVKAKKPATKATAVKACMGYPTDTAADYDYAFVVDEHGKTEGYFDGYKVSKLYGYPDIMDVKPDKKALAHGRYQFWISPFGLLHEPAYAAYKDIDGKCQTRMLLAHAGKGSEIVNGSDVPYTIISTTLPPGATLEYIKIGVNNVKIVGG